MNNYIVVTVSYNNRPLPNCTFKQLLPNRLDGKYLLALGLNIIMFVFLVGINTAGKLTSETFMHIKLNYFDCTHTILPNNLGSTSKEEHLTDFPLQRSIDNKHMYGYQK